MRNVLLALAMTVVVMILGTAAAVGAAEIMYGGSRPPESFFRFTTLSLTPIAVVTFIWTRRLAGRHSSALASFAESLSPMWPNCPPARIALLLALFGLAVIAATAYIFWADGNSNFLQRVAFDRPYYYRSYFVWFWIGAVCATIGALGAFYWNSTFARLLRWIQGS